MHTITTVIDELFTFSVSITDRVLGLVFDTTTTRGKAPTLSPEVADIPELVSIAEEFDTAVELPITDEEPEVSTFHSTAEILNEQVSSLPIVAAPVAEATHTIQYAAGAETPLFKAPTKLYDSLLAKLPYAAMVMPIEHQGRWAKVGYQELVGWVLRDDLVDKAASVYPELVVGSANQADDPNTVRIRAFIDDMYAGSLADLPLQAGEYVTYRLLRKGTVIPWGEERPRTEGRWHELLKGVGGVRSSIKPKTGSVMEYLTPEESGHLAFVESVTPDETITVSEANFPDTGIYNERTLAEAEWKEYRPVFIQIT